MDGAKLQSFQLLDLYSRIVQLFYMKETPIFFSSEPCCSVVFPFPDLGLILIPGSGDLDPTNGR